MLDYEIFKYEVNYLRNNHCSYSTTSFNTEAEAIKFIKEERWKWKEYKLIKIQTAVIDF